MIESGKSSFYHKFSETIIFSFLFLFSNPCVMTIFLEESLLASYIVKVNLGEVPVSIYSTMMNTSHNVAGIKQMANPRFSVVGDMKPVTVEPIHFLQFPNPYKTKRTSGSPTAAQKIVDPIVYWTL